MSESQFKLPKPPIVEAVLDIECDMPAGQQLASLEAAARENFRDRYPKFRTQFLQEHQIVTKADEPPKMSVRRGMQALQLLQHDEKQLVQLRVQGFSFNRLAPYTSLDDCLPEIERTWRLFVSIAAPVQIRSIRLRYINRILIPMGEKQFALENYLKVGPRLPDEDKLTFTGFLNQHTAVEADTGNQVNIVLTTQPPEEKKLPLIFDITVTSAGTAEVENWTCLLATIQALRALKNRVFRNTLTERCLNLFRQP